MASAPSPFRWRILLLLFLAMTVNMLDRQVLSLVAPMLRDQLGFSDTGYGAVVFCFLLGMSLGQVPVGVWIDRKGARWGFAAILAYWSAVNALHAFATGLLLFGLLRFLLGIGECGTYSVGVKVIGEWFRPRERALASGLFNSGSLVGAIVAPPLIVYLALHYGWRAAFLIPGTAGCLWLLPWLRSYRPGPEIATEDPADASALPPVRSLLRLTPVWGVILIRAFSGPVTHFYWYWLPEYLRHARGLPMSEVGLLAWLPFFSGAVGNIGGGWLSSALIRRGWTIDRARKRVMTGAIALCLAAAAVPFSATWQAALGLICLGSLGVNAVAANLMGVIGDLFPSAILARVSGLTGVGDGVVAMVAMFATGYVVDRFSYMPVFIAAGVMPLVSLAALYGLVGVVRPLNLARPATA